MQDTQRDLMNVMYGTGYNDGVKAGKKRSSKWTYENYVGMESIFWCSLMWYYYAIIKAKKGFY